MPTSTFNYTGGWQRFTVPKGVKSLEVTVEGGGSGTVEGGHVHGYMVVRPGRVLFIQVGQEGQLASGSNPGAAAFGGGAAGGAGVVAGNGGGGASVIRYDSRTGLVRVVAGGAGGGAGDGALGGAGGDDVGAWGGVGPAMPNASTAGTGGSQTQGGKGGTSPLGTIYWGQHGQDVPTGLGGTGGGVAGRANVRGGGGGGGGYYPGGGGAASVDTFSNGSGGGGGSNYVDPLTTRTNSRSGGTGHGRVVISWLAPGDQPPTPPNATQIAGKDAGEEMVTRAVDRVIVRGTPVDPDARQVRLLIRMSTNKTMVPYTQWRGTYDPRRQRDTVTLTGLLPDTLYYLRLYTEDNRGVISRSYRTASFWTNRSPFPPDLNFPTPGAQATAIENVTFEWNHNDPDLIDTDQDSQTAFNLRYRIAGTAITDPGPWVEVGIVATSQQQHTLAAGTFRANTLYEWSVQTRDEQQKWGPWAEAQDFYITGKTATPALLAPTNDEALVDDEDVLFMWQFRHPFGGIPQVKADIRYRVVGTSDWVTYLGTTTTPGAEQTWLIPAGTFTAGYRYEWQARTYVMDASPVEGEPDVQLPSDWSESTHFWVARSPDIQTVPDLLGADTPQPALGVGNNKVFVYERGGQKLRGEITPLVSISWGRRRDDISNAVVMVNQWSDEQRNLYNSLRAWMHELVIFRDGVRVWEGPITRIAGRQGRLEIEAQDPSAYLYRRIMRQGYSDAYRIMNGQQMGQKTVVQRAAQIAMNALVYDDPNVLPYLTLVTHHDDARTSRTVPEYSRTAWEEIDELAATAGLDYTCLGRRIIFWDTHRPLGRLPEMRDGDFGDTPIVTEYGMSAANYFAVTDNNGTWGAASRIEGGDPGPTGWIEQLASAYGENEEENEQTTLTQEQRERKRVVYTEQAERNIAGRWPTPVVVRVPDNSTLSPTLNIGINQLVPGVWLPLRSDGALRDLYQWQKLDSIDVRQEEESETITATLSPAPNGGEDPDAVASVAAEV